MKPGEIHCISGSNSDGKTTLSKIIMGLLEPHSGEVIVDGTDLNKFSLKWWKRQVAYVPQRPDIINSSIMDNILLGNKNLDEQEVSRLLQTVGLDEKLKKSNLTITDIVDNNISKGILKKFIMQEHLRKIPKFFY